MNPARVPLDSRRARRWALVATSFLHGFGLAFVLTFGTALGLLGGAARAAGVTSVAPAALQQHLQSHDKVVVYFTSPDPRCGYCAGSADQAFAQVAALLDGDVSVIRVAWTPWVDFPNEVRALRVTAIPVTRVYKGGVPVDQVNGRVIDPPRFAETIRAGLRKGAPALEASGPAAPVPTATPAAPRESIAATGAPRPLDPADFGWDLSYRRVLDAHHVDRNEFVREWLSRFPTRPVYEKFARYAGEPVIATLLIEQPDGHAGDPQATWVVRTARAAGVCAFHPKYMNVPCQPLGPERADAFIREVMAMPAMRPGSGAPRVIGKRPDGSPSVLGYLGFLSIWVDGRSMQRPIAFEELMSPDGDRAAPSIATFGPLSRALYRLSEAESAAAASPRR